MNKIKNKKLNEEERSDAWSETDAASVLSSDSSVYPKSESSDGPDSEDSLRASSDDLAAEIDVAKAKFMEVVRDALLHVANWRENFFKDEISNELRLVRKNEKLRADQARLQVGPREASQVKREHEQSHNKREKTKNDKRSAKNQDMNLVQQKLGNSKQRVTELEDIVLGAPLAASQTDSVSGSQNATSLTTVTATVPKPCLHLKTVLEPGKSAPEKAKPPLKPNTGGVAANVSERRQRRILAELDPDVLLEVATAKARLVAPDTPPEVILKEAMTEIFDKGTAVVTPRRWWNDMDAEAEFILEVAIVKSWIPNKTAEVYIREAISEQCSEVKPRFRRVYAWPCPRSTQVQPPWWSQELATLRIVSRKARRRFSRYRKRRIRPPDAETKEAELLKEHQAAKALYKAELKRAKALALET